MRYFAVVSVLICIYFVCNSVPQVDANPYWDADEDVSDPGNYLEVVLQPNGPEKRACIRRGGNCDHRPNDCCYNSSCRCNLWGSNCRCQRMGLFQKWG